METGHYGSCSIFVLSWNAIQTVEMLVQKYGPFNLPCLWFPFLAHGREKGQRGAGLVTLRMRPGTFAQ